MTNRVEALFLCRALVLMRLIRARGDSKSFALFQTLLPTPSVTFIGIILSLASLWHWHYWSIVQCFSNGALLPAECKLRQQRKYSSCGVRCLSQTCSWCLPSLLHLLSTGDVWGVLSLSPLMLCCPPTAPLSPLPFQALIPQWESRGSPCICPRLRPVLLVLYSPRLTPC